MSNNLPCKRRLICIASFAVFAKQEISKNEANANHLLRRRILTPHVLPLLRQPLPVILSICPLADCGSAHNPVIAKFKLKLKKLREAKPSKKLDLGLFKTVPNVKEDFVLEVNNRFQVLAEANTTDIETEWIYVEALERVKQHSLGHKAGWNEKVRPYQDRAKLWFNIWQENGRPENGFIRDIMVKTKREYKRVLKWLVRNQDQIQSDRMADAILSNDDRFFWDEVKRKTNNASSVPNAVEGLQGNESICEMFAQKYENLYSSVPYEESEMSGLLEHVDALIESNFFRVVINISCSVRSIMEQLYKIFHYRKIKLIKENGRPENGLIRDIMVKTKREYKRVLKWLVRNQDQIQSDRMANAILSNDDRFFWDEVKRKTNNASSVPNAVEGLQGNESICEMFAQKYENLYSSVSYEESEMSVCWSMLMHSLSPNCLNSRNRVVSYVAKISRNSSSNIATNNRRFDYLSKCHNFINSIDLRKSEMKYKILKACDNFKW
ncbi:hypothetical protein CAPTEDRAFT_210188 [Capitella teleta]|uniref:Uncharacterized protein n=1 Tax=Capitella teleta TaxID=283909 RepID=R7U2A1_CAPTE|nr:hypothetical protein CAPTEDRAFT_210188 [Capitella teleta]|eukprot:ELT97786.1 hypothetical protein CAPTEDRAFT_210188 [Capitella teleta]